MLQRDRQPEWMDDPKIDPDLHKQALVGLSRLNRLSGVAGAMYSHVRKYARAIGPRPMRILDVASGAADVPIHWACRAKRDRLNLEITTVDISGTAVEQQQKSAQAAGVQLHPIEMDCLKHPLPTGFDMVTCSLFMHHLDDHDSFRLLQSMQSATEDAILICDLERSRLNLALVTIGSRLVTRSPVVHFDGPASVRAAYTAQEFKRLAQSALTRPIQVRSVIPCRFIAKFEEKAVTEQSVAFA